MNEVKWDTTADENLASAKRHIEIARGNLLVATHLDTMGADEYLPEYRNKVRAVAGELYELLLKLA